MPLLHTTKFSSQKHHWKTKATAKCKNNAKWRAAGNFIRLKIMTLKTQRKNFTSRQAFYMPKVSISDHWTEQTLHKDYVA